MADQAQGKDGGASAANIAAAMALLPACIGPPPNPMACAMMAMALMQAGKDNQHAGDAGLTSISAAPGGGFEDSDSGTSGLGSEKKKRDRGGSGLTPGQQRDLETAQDILAQNGFSLDGNGTLTGSDGSSIPSSAFGNPGGLGNFGLSQDDVENAKKAKAIADGAVNKFKSQSGDAGGGGGGGGAKAAKFEIPEFDPSLFALPKPKAAPKKKFGSQYAGYSRSLAGERIGVAGDNIFKMVDRRYKAKVRANYFLP